MQTKVMMSVVFIAILTLVGGPTGRIAPAYSQSPTIYGCKVVWRTEYNIVAQLKPGKAPCDEDSGAFCRWYDDPFCREPYRVCFWSDGGATQTRTGHLEPTDDPDEVDVPCNGYIELDQTTFAWNNTGESVVCEPQLCFGISKNQDRIDWDLGLPIVTGFSALICHCY